MARSDYSVGEEAQVVQGDTRGFGIQTPQHIADHAHRSGTAGCLKPTELAVRLLDGLELEPDRRARAFEPLFGDPAVIEADCAQPHPPPPGPPPRRYR